MTIQSYARTKNLTSVEPSYQEYLGSVTSSISNIARFIFVPDVNPEWENAIFKVVAGVFGILANDKLVHDGTPSDYAYDWISTALLITGLREVFALLYNKLITENKQTTKKNKSFRKAENDQKMISAKMGKLAKVIFFSAISLNCLYNHELLGNAAYFSNQRAIIYFGGLTNFGDTNFNLKLFQSVVCVTHLVLNILEIKQFKEKSFLDNNPITEILNALSLAFFCLQIGMMDKATKTLWNCILKEGGLSDLCYDFLPSNPQERMTVINNLEWSVQLALEGIDGGMGAENISLNVYLFKRVVKIFTQQVMLTNTVKMLKKNVDNYFKQTPLITREVIFLEIAKEIKKSNQKQYDISIIPNPSLNEKEDDEIRMQELSSLSDEKEIIPREKVKTKGKGNIKKDTKKDKQIINTSSSKSSKTASIDLLKKERKEGLARIRELRKEYPVKAVKIQTELKRAADFLNGNIVPVDGNEFKIEWKMGDNLFGMKYEIPHGYDSSNYKGNKLDRVLNVLETAYLVGLSEDLALKYIQEYNLYNLYKFPKFLYYIFSNKTTC